MEFQVNDGELHRVLYKDDEYFFKVRLNPHSQFRGNRLTVYKKRKRTLFNWKQYEVIGDGLGTKSEALSDIEIKRFIEKYLARTKKKPRLIECSPDVEALYK